MSGTRDFQDDSIQRFSALLAEISARCTTKAQLRGIHRLTCSFLSFHGQLECADAEINSGDYATHHSHPKMEELSTSDAGSEYCKRWCYCARHGLNSDKARDDSSKTQTLLSLTRYPSPRKVRSSPAALYRLPTPYVSPASSYYCALSLPTMPNNYDDALSISTGTVLTTDSSSSGEVCSDSSDAN